MEKIILESISEHMKDKKVIRNSQYRFTKEKLANLIAFYSEVTSFVDDWSPCCLPLL